MTLPATGSRERLPQSAALPRTPFWDVARGLGILLVVYGHVARGLMTAGVLPSTAPWTALDALIYSFHMPLFFYISGRFFPATFVRQGPAQLMRRKVGSIAYPYLLWSLIQGGIEVALAGLTNHGGRPAIAGILLTPIDQFWFLYALFLIFGVATAVYSIRFHPAWVLLAIAGILFFTDVSTVAWSGIGYVAYYLLFFSLGSVTAGARAPFLGLSAGGTGAVALVSLAELIVLQAGALSPLGLHSLWLQRISGFACALAGCSFILCAASLARGRFAMLMALLGRCSMEIYLLHILAASGIRIVITKLFGLHDPALHLLLGLIVGTFLPILVARTLRRRGGNWLFEWPRTATSSAG